MGNEYRRGIPITAHVPRCFHDALFEELGKTDTPTSKYIIRLIKKDMASRGIDFSKYTYERDEEIAAARNK